MTQARTHLLLLACCTLTACASVIPQPQSPAIDSVAHKPIKHASLTSGLPPTTSTVSQWDKLRASFAMDDCGDDARIQAWAHRYAYHPRLFAAQIRHVLPRLTYVQQIAAKYAVPGEFVLLPWVESGFRPLSGWSRQSAGMWQIMPWTARSIGLPMNNDYDGRLDVPVATEAVMSLLARYYRQMHDWRLVDYAYNAGEFAIRDQLRSYGTPPPQPIIPSLPVPSITRNHLIKLLAISCVIREPARFHVVLPQLPAKHHLVTVAVPKTLTLRTAARYTGMSRKALHALNAAFRHGVIKQVTAPHLLLPLDRAQKLDQALARSASASASAKTVATHGPHNKPPLSATRHRIHRGESLWRIAQRYHVNIRQLKQWNRLRSDSIKPGQWIIVSRPD